MTGSDTGLSLVGGSVSNLGVKAKVIYYDK